MRYLTGAPVDDRGSLPMAMLMTLVSVALSALLASIVTAQIDAAKQSRQRVHALHAAQAGIETALGQIRASDGTRSLMPCGPISGSVSAAGTSRYQVTIDYLPAGENPENQPDTWIDTDANPIACNASTGPISTPRYALLRSRGTELASGAITAVSGRTVRATYKIKLTDEIAASGGLIHVYKLSTSTDLCLDAGSATPAAGTRVRVQPCSPASAEQNFTYNTNLTISLFGSSMCLQAGATHSNGTYVTLENCATVTSYLQQWSWNAAQSFMGVNSSNNTDGYCFNVQSPNVAGSYVILSNSNCGGGYDNIHSFSPDAKVGAGASGAAVGNLVNYDQYGRCVDVTGGDVNYSHHILWPCKQAPDPADLDWNQVWVIPTISTTTNSGTGQIYTTRSLIRYCLVTPGSTASGQYVLVTPCLTASTQTSTWTVYQETGNPLTNYRIIDSFGYCLMPTNPDEVPPDLYAQGTRISKLVVATCSSSSPYSRLQKWNAPPDADKATSLTDIRER